MKYRVTYEVRNAGAIGVFTPRTFEVEADTACGDGGATSKVLALITADGSLEPRTSTTIQKWNGEEWEFIPWKAGFGYIETPEDKQEYLRGTNNGTWSKYRWLGPLN